MLLSDNTDTKIKANKGSLKYSMLGKGENQEQSKIGLADHEKMHFHNSLLPPCPQQRR